MPAVRISDIYEPTVWKDHDSLASVEKTAFVQSGVMVSNPVLDAKAADGGRMIELPFWKDLAVTDPNISSDDPAVRAVPEKIGTGVQVARVSHLNKSWQATDLASQLAGANAMFAIKDLTEAYWSKVLQRRAIATGRGILADSIAHHGGDLVYDVSTDASGAATSAELFNSTAFTKAVFTLGDAFDQLGTIAMHSTVYSRLVQNDEIETIQDSKTGLMVRLYKGHHVVQDDGMPAIAGTNRIKFISMIFGGGAFGFGKADPAVPVAVERDEQAANGAGVETLITRKQWIIHPRGFAFNSASVAGISPTAPELANGANWTRVAYERKQLPVAFLLTNG